MRPIAQLGALGKQPRRHLLREHLFAPARPNRGRTRPCTCRSTRADLMRRVAGTGREPEEERLRRRRGAQVGEVEAGHVDHVLGEVVPLLRRARRVDLVVVVHEIGVVLVGLAAEEAVEPLEAATERPPVARASGDHRARGREMPLADRERRVPVAHEDLGDHPVRLRHGRVVSRKPRCELDDATHAVAMVVAACQQAGARRRAQRRRVEVRVAQAVRREPIECRRRDVEP